MKTDAVFARPTWLSDISQHAATLVGLLVIGALACGLGLAFALVVQHVFIADGAHGIRVPRSQAPASSCKPVLCEIPGRT